MSGRKQDDEEIRPKEQDERQEWEDLDEYEEDSDQEEYYEDDLDLEENVRIEPKKILFFCGLFVLAVLICIPLWKLTHKQIGKEAGTDPAVTETPAPATAQPENTPAPATAQPENTPAPATAQPENTPPPATAQPANTQPPSGTQTPSSPELQEPISGNASMRFLEVSDSVTAKDVTNLRSVPSTEDAENVVGQLQNGETLTRTGLNDDTGWSRLEYNGETVYAVTRYLTTDLNYKTPAAPANPNRITTQDGRVIIFTDNDDYITPKEYVNLRTEPSTSQGEATVRCQVSNGESIHRTGYSPDSGWSRVEYNGETLYVVSSYMTAASAE